MSERDEPDSARQVAEHLLAAARSDLGLSRDAVRSVFAAPAHGGESYQSLAGLADAVMGRRPLAEHVVDGFYSRARRGARGERAFLGGAEAMAIHGYPPIAIDALPAQAVGRFLGLGNTYHAIAGSAGGRVVDIGCGAGVDLGVAAMLCPDTTLLVGVDKRPDLLHVVAAACPRADLVVGDVTALPFTVDAFDTVLANGLPPLQRPATLRSTADALQSIAAEGGVVSVTVIVAAPRLTAALAEVFPDDDVLARGLAVLISGKPTIADVISAFSSQSVVTVTRGENPYREPSARRRTAMYAVRAVKG
ncbi:methyltransferase domain-containing protein [Nocardia caishijiensis]|uniref:Methyltransferase family protein n=1 Tax=Nocardia caishijiensis TaxID=184756 RepID=A0ABQ6YHL8_9NOCA|nr:class I SAM-dependent methyltransferase [Nocardia caishijiensis]KAF0845265.1 methyltransferase family protein [Nocardia caishijiensis]